MAELVVECSRSFSAQEYNIHDAARLQKTGSMNMCLTVRVQDDSSFRFCKEALQKACRLAQAQHPSLRTCIRPESTELYVGSLASVEPIAIQTLNDVPHPSFRTHRLDFKKSGKPSNADLVKLAQSELARPFEYRPFAVPVRFLFVSDKLVLFTMDHRLADGTAGNTACRCIFDCYQSIVRRPSFSALVDSSTDGLHPEYSTYEPSKSIPRAEDVSPRGISAYFLALLRVVEILSSLLSLSGLPERLARRPSRKKLTWAAVLAFIIALPHIIVSFLRSCHSTMYYLIADHYREGEIETDLVLFQFSEKETSMIRSMCKTHKITVGAFLLTAFSSAFACATARKGEKNRKMKLWSQFVVDMRRFYEPEAYFQKSSAGHFITQGNFVSVIDCFLKARPCPCLDQTDFSGPPHLAVQKWRVWFWNQCREVRNAMMWTIKSGGLMRSMLFVEHVRWLTKRLQALPQSALVAPTFSLSNLGAFDGSNGNGAVSGNGTSDALASAASPVHSVRDVVAATLPAEIPGSSESTTSSFSSLPSDKSSVPGSLSDLSQSDYFQHFDMFCATTAPLAIPHCLITTVTVNGKLSGTIGFANGIVDRSLVEAVVVHLRHIVHCCLYDALRSEKKIVS
eukprot:ANDGO_03067.mRNA.1 hypothetical protein